MSVNYRESFVGGFTKCFCDHVVPLCGECAVCIVLVYEFYSFLVSCSTEYHIVIKYMQVK